VRLVDHFHSTNVAQGDYEMHLRNTAIAATLVLLTSSPAWAENFLVHIYTGPDNPTVAALGFLVAMTAQKEGNTVTVFLAGDGASLITDASIGSVEGKGTGKLKDSFDTLIKGGAHIYISGMSAKARNVTEADLAGKSAEFAMPAKLVELAAAADVVLAY
jgi:predicted peroxiredoxin